MAIENGEDEEAKTKLAAEKKEIEELLGGKDYVRWDEMLDDNKEQNGPPRYLSGDKKDQVSIESC